MDRVLVTGANGFIGSNLLEYCNKCGFESLGVANVKSQILNDGVQKIINVDILDSDGLARLIKRYRPNNIVHLAAQSSPTESWRDINKCIAVNYSGTINLLNAVVRYSNTTKVLVTSSSSIYADSGSKPLSESDALSPDSPYAVSKLAIDHMSILFSKYYDLDISIIRPFFIIGPGKKGDVCSEWAKKIVDIEKGYQKKLEVGNIKGVVRDFLPIEDCISAIECVIKCGNSGSAYNICSNVGTPLLDILDFYKKTSSINFDIEISKEKVRKFDKQIVVGNNNELKKIGWKQKKSIKECLSNIKSYWEQR